MEETRVPVRLVTRQKRFTQRTGGGMGYKAG